MARLQLRPVVAPTVRVLRSPITLGILGTGLFGLAAWYIWRRIPTGKTISTAQTAKFAAALPSSCRPYAAHLIEAGKKHAVSPFMLAAIMQRESNCGAALRSGTGDFAPRSRSRADSASSNLGVTIPVRDAGNGQVLPADGLGWGRGLMQIDYMFHYRWIRSNNWQDPRTNIMKGAEILALGARTLRLRGITGDQLELATLSAYNAGAGNALRAIRNGLSPDAYTTGGDYGADVMRRAKTLESRFA